jgi:hypothetical protein
MSTCLAERRIAAEGSNDQALSRSGDAKWSGYFQTMSGEDAQDRKLDVAVLRNPGTHWPFVALPAPKGASRRASALLLSDHEVHPSLANVLLGSTPLEDSAPQVSSHAGTR